MDFAVYIQVDESEKLPDLNPESKVGTLNPNTFESGWLCK